MLDVIHTPLPKPANTTLLLRLPLYLSSAHIHACLQLSTHFLRVTRRGCVGGCEDVRQPCRRQRARAAALERIGTRHAPRGGRASPRAGKHPTPRFDASCLRPPRRRGPEPLRVVSTAASDACGGGGARRHRRAVGSRVGGGSGSHAPAEAAAVSDEEGGGDGGGPSREGGDDAYVPRRPGLRPRHR